ncbi:MAG TPA: lytic transglycosylase domain-containing protein [Alphaproteobacteria bacterium]
MINHLFAACLMMAANTYAVPPQVLVGILHVEGGRIGQQVGNTNGSFDLGPMQINSLWVPELAKYWGVPQKTAWTWLRDDGCTNVNVAAWILRSHLNETGSLATAVAHYHSRTPSKGGSYKNKVVDVMRKKGLLTGAPPPEGPAAVVTTRETTKATESKKIVRTQAKRLKIGQGTNTTEDKG